MVLKQIIILTTILQNPISNPTINGITLIGAGSLSAGKEFQAVKLRVGTKGKFDNMVLSNWEVGFDIQHDESVAAVAAGELKATRVKFDNVLTKSIGKNTAGTTVDVSKVFSEDNAATGAGNGIAQPEWSKGWTVGF